MTNKNKTVVVGLSGGVDSSVAAYLLQKQGFRVIGLFMHNWEEDDEDGSCTSAADYRDAQSVASALKIPCYSVNFAKEYQARVFKYFLEEYKAGRTPNPDVLCNREVKFGPFAEYAKKLGADYIATGHYCCIDEVDGLPHLVTAVDENKDQTYFLNQVKTEQLQNVLFPIGGLKKSEVRALAEQMGLVTAKKKDSTGICFIGERKFRTFLKQYLPAQPGDIVDLSGVTLGRHEGLMYYTLGQRRGLNIGGVAGMNQSRWYVVEKDLKLNKLIVSCGEGEELFTDSLEGSNLNIIGAPLTDSKLRLAVKTRYRQPAQPATVTFLDSGRIRVKFDTPQRAVTPGQYAVLYQGVRCVGGAVIDATDGRG